MLWSVVANGKGSRHTSRTTVMYVNICFPSLGIGSSRSLNRTTLFEIVFPSTGMVWAGYDVAGRTGNFAIGLESELELEGIGLGYWARYISRCLGFEW
jgi:hypothetical protein